MANRYPLVLNGTTIEELQDGDTLIGVSAAGSASNADNLKVGVAYLSASMAADNNTIAARTATGLLHASTAAQTINDTTLATTSYVKTAISNLINSAPGTLDTLNELAAAINNDSSFSVTMTNVLATKAPLASPSFTGTVTGITKSMVGLGSVDNTADINKSVSSAVTSTNLAGGVTGSLPYQSSLGNTSFLNPGTSGYVLKSNGANNAPSWVDVSGLVAGISVGDTSGQNGINLELSTGTITGTCSGLATTANVQFASLQTTSITTGASTTAGSITGSWTLSAGSTLQSTYADLAEKYLSDKDYEVGTVLVVGGDFEVTASNYGQRAIGVVTSSPAYIMNNDLENGILVALRGRVPIKITGGVSKGDRLVASANGTAAQAQVGSNDVFAIALETNYSHEIKLIECVLL